INAGKSFLAQNSTVTTEANFADGGTIQLSAGKLVYLSNSEVSAVNRSGFATQGNIGMDSPFVILNHSNVVANAFENLQSGNLNIGADVFLASSDSTVFASSVLSLLAAITNISGLLQPLPENIQATALLQQSCAARFSGGKLSSLVVG